MAGWGRRVDPIWVVVVAVALTYGARAVDTMNGPDENYFRALDRGGIWTFWLGQERWAMALSSMPLGQPVVTAVPVVLGAGLTSWAIWRYLREGLDVTRWAAAAGTAVGVTVPALVLQTAWRTNSLGIGIAFLAASQSVRLARGATAGRRPAAVLLAAYAIGTYQSMLLVLGCMLLGVVLRRPTVRNAVALVGLPASGAGVSWVVALVLGWVTSVPATGYGDDLLGGGGDAEAVSRYLRVLGGAWTVVGVTQPWTGIAVLASSLALTAAWVRQGGAGWVRITALAALLAVPLVVLLLVAVPLRSELYWVVIVGVVVALGIERLDDGRARPLVVGAAVLVGMAVLGNAQIANAQYLAGRDTQRLDDHVAGRILDEYLEVADDGRERAVVMVPCTWPRPPYWAGREYFDYGSMYTDPGQAAARLRFQGMAVRVPTTAEVERGTRVLASMPRYPDPGWVAVHDDLLLVRCGEDQPFIR